MIHFFNNIKDLYNFITSIGVTQRIGNIIKQDGKEYVDNVSCIDLVYVNAETGEIVGTEGEDYKPKDGEIYCWAIR